MFWMAGSEFTRTEVQFSCGSRKQLTLQQRPTTNTSTSFQNIYIHIQWIHSRPKEVYYSILCRNCFSTRWNALTYLFLELLNLHNSFHQGQYSTVVGENVSTLSPENQLAAKVYILRARIQTGEAEAVIQELGDASEPELQAVKAFAEYTTGNEESAVSAIDGLVASSADNGTVQVLGATVLHLAGRSDDALSLLSKHQGNLEA
jgi:hypothetical protein